MTRYIDPMPAHVRVEGTGTTIYECAPCHEASHYPKGHYDEEGGFLELYKRLQERAWQHNMNVHVHPNEPRPSNPAAVSPGEQLTLF